ncbi:UPF0182 family membrane protein [Glycomyces salinus]|uniref:UPF0182 family membrane protein n=1 Tax=Glycomyces salinus TaxID=980294 RepID=UPI0018EAAB6C|nr:UPF0182 family protein [Glycomyces salinus]
MLILLVAAIVLLSVLGWLVSLRTNYLWYDSVDYTTVFSTMMWTRIGLFGVFTLAMAAWTALNLYIAYRFRPDTWPATAEQEGLERYRELLSPRAGWWIAGLAAVIGIFAGMSAQSRWETWLLFREGGSFGWTDPIFDRDAGFYVFKLPFWEFMIGFGFAAVIVAILASLGAYYLYGALRFSGQGDRMTNAARIHLSVLVALFLGLKAVAYYFDRFDFVNQQNEVTNVVGGGYTEIEALMHAKTALIWVSLIAAVVILVFSWGLTRSLALPGAALGLVVVTAIAAGGIYPAVVRNFQVEPNVPQREGEYVQYTIDGTRFGFGLGEGTLDSTTYQVDSRPNAETLNEDTETVPNTRLIDPSLVSDAFTQGQQPRSFYAFEDKLDIDRYTYENEAGDTVTEDFVVGVRELDPNNYNESQQDWTVRYTQLTHGWGLVSAPTREVCGEGLPLFTSGVMRGDDDDETSRCVSSVDYIEVDQPQIYFGMLNNDYAIVGVEEGDDPVEFDRPADVAVSEEAEQTEEGEETEVVSGEVRTTWQGDSGVDLGSWMNRLLYAWEFQEPRFLLSDRVNGESQLLYDRNVRDRVEKVAPFLTIDSDPYPAAVDGEIVWVIDGYTTANDFPYSDRVNLAGATSDTYTGAGTATQESEDVNYMRSSVKAVVNAYTGEVTLYEWDDEDPILQAWNEVYGGDLVVPKEEVLENEELVAHFRYAQDMFSVQREVLERYHVDDSGTFIENSEAWDVPDDPASASETTQPAYYVYASYGLDEAAFQLTTTFTPVSRDNIMSAMMSGHYDADGKPVLNLLQIAGSDTQSARQMHQLITQDQTVVDDLRQYQQANLDVEWGNLLAMPVGSGIMYVEPLYLRRQVGGGSTTLPVLQNVAISYGGHVGYAETFEDALESVVDKYLSGEQPVEVDPDDEGGEDTTEEPTDEPTEDPTTETPAETPDSVDEAIQDVLEAQAAYEEAQASGTNEEIGAALDDLFSALDALEQARQAAGE